MRTVGILGALLGLALVGSYVTFTSDGEPLADGAVVVVDAAPDQLASVVWTDDTQRVLITRKTDSLGVYYAVSIDVMEAPKPVDDGKADTDAADKADEAAAPEPTAPPVVTKTVQFTGGEAVKAVWEGLAPLVAVREIVQGDAGLAAYGLDDSDTSLVLNLAGGETKLAIGDETFGTRDRYVSLGSRILLIDDQTLRPIEHAQTRLMERALAPLREAETAQISVTHGSDTRTYVHRHLEDAEKAFWALSAEPDTKDGEGAAWGAKALRLRAQRAVPEAELPAAMTPVFTYEVKGKSGPAWRVEISKAEADGATHWYANSAYLRGVVEIPASLAEGVADDLGVLFDGKAEPAEQAPAAPTAEPGVVPLAPGVADPVKATTP